MPDATYSQDDKDDSDIPTHPLVERRDVPVKPPEESDDESSPAESIGS